MSRNALELAERRPAFRRSHAAQAPAEAGTKNFARRGWLLLAAMLACPGLSAAAEGNLNLTVSTPRSFGYVIGDVIRHQAQLDVDAAYQLDPAALPKPGPLNRWLSLRKIETEHSVDGTRRRYRLNVEYQSFYAPLTVKTLSIPPLALRLHGPGGDINAALPTWAFSTAPIRGLAAAEADGAVALRPEAEPLLLASGRDALALGLCSGVALALLAYLGYGWGWLGQRRRGRHFAHAATALRRLRNSEPAPALCRTAFSLVHQGFNLTLGASLFSDDLPDFFQQHPRYAPLRGEIEAFFQASYRLFFSDDGTAIAADFPLQRLQTLCRACIRIEQEAA